ncbi:putative C-mannosyltransferase DPY19L2 [Liparis tanakae]|uniref:Putative C-mannosyltransferase DPY19L2 n=1 Tax=Liparis tanakae TaxID=230148 RepID=A0A4Z2EEM7_9TELE|nr:putative C-mannosyltransferase DPY19L2 [Liparis tanakae]
MYTCAAEFDFMELETPLRYLRTMLLPVNVLRKAVTPSSRHTSVSNNEHAVFSHWAVLVVGHVAVKESPFQLNRFIPLVYLQTVQDVVRFLRDGGKPSVRPEDADEAAG